MTNLAKEIPKFETESIIRFIIKIGISDGCWVYKGEKRKDGYGTFYFKGKNYPAHRISYELFTNTKIPTHLVIDHLCRNPSCVRPDHLEVVTHRENIARGNGLPQRMSLITHCKRGHELKGDNLRFRKGKEHWRECKICHRILSKEFMRRKRSKDPINIY